MDAVEFINGVKFRQLYRSKRRSYGRTGGAIVVRRRLRGSAKIFRLIDLRRNLIGESGILVRCEFDPNRGAYIGLIFYKNLGLFNYMLLPDKALLGMLVMNCIEVTKGFSYKLFLGSSFLLKDIPLSMPIYNIEKAHCQGGKLVRAAGTFGRIIRRFLKIQFVGVQLPSGKLYFISWFCFATVGQVSNLWLKLKVLLKAGASAHKGVRPRVRGVAMNPVDHPHGGGEGKTSGGRSSVSKWGMLTKGARTQTLKKRKHLIKLTRRINMG